MSLSKRAFEDAANPEYYGECLTCCNDAAPDSVYCENCQVERAIVSTKELIAHLRTPDPQAVQATEDALRAKILEDQERERAIQNSIYLLDICCEDDE